MVDLPTSGEPVRIVEGDCLEAVRALPDASVDAVITDPPYPHIKREYGFWTEAEWFALMNPLVEECRRVLKPTGSAVFVLQPNSERVGRMRTWLWEFMAKWGKEWGMVQDAYWWNSTQMPESLAIQGRLMRPAIKPCVWLGSPDCYRNQDAVLLQPAEVTKSHSHLNRYELTPRINCGGRKQSQGRMLNAWKARGGVTPHNVTVCSNSGTANPNLGHPAGTPLALCRWWARYICPPGGTVLEPFLGSGTVALAALDEGRRCIGIERMPKYAEIARKRIAERLDAGLFNE